MNDIVRRHIPRASESKARHFPPDDLLGLNLSVEDKVTSYPKRARGCATSYYIDAKAISSRPAVFRNTTLNIPAL